MSKEKKDLTTEELLKKLMESFGADPEEAGGEQMTIDEISAEQNKKRVYKPQKGKKDALGSLSEDEGEVSETLRRSIRNAEMYAEGMSDEDDDWFDDDEESEESEESEEPDEPEELEELEESDEPEELEELEEPEESEEPEEPEELEELEEPDEPEEPEEFEEPEEPDEPEEPEEPEELEELEELEEPDEPEEPEESEESEESEEFEEQEEPEILPVFGDADRDEKEAFDVFEEEDAEEAVPEKDVSDAEDTLTGAEETDKKPRDGEENAEKQDENAEEPDENEAHLMMIFGMDKALEKKIGKKRVDKLRREIDGDAAAQTVEEEYESVGQNKEFFEKFRRAYKILNIRSILAVLLLVFVAFFEAGPVLFKGTYESIMGKTVIDFLDHPINAALVAMQITMLVAAVAYKEILNGFRTIGNGRSSPEVFLSLTVVFSLLYEGGMIYCHSVKAQFYNLPLALCALLAVLFTRMNLKRNLMAFKIISTKKPKLAIVSKSDKESKLEKEAFGDCISDMTDIYGVEKTEFISGYASRSAKEPGFKGIVGVLAAAVAVIGLIFFLVGYYFSPEEEGKLKLLSAFSMSMLSVLFCMPFSAFIIYSLPFFKASRRAYANGSAIIGEYSLEDYDNASVISFDDKEVFPPKNVRVRSLKLFGDSRIDHVLFGAASVFRKLGGPLDEVFAVATKESGITEDVELIDVAENGVETSVKGIRVYIGSSVFMRERNLLTSIDEADEQLEMEGKISIMYLAIGGELAAKMYVEYKADREIKGIMESLYKSGMCIGIRTFDPNINDRMLRRNGELSGYPVKVLRMEKAEENRVEGSIDSGVVSKKDTKSLLKAFASCRRVLQVIKAGTGIKICGAAVGIGVSVLLLLFRTNGKLGGFYEINSLWTTLYQICWTLVSAAIALFFA